MFKAKSRKSSVEKEKFTRELVTRMVEAENREHKTVEQTAARSTGK
jgi:hypothetical protein